MAWLFVLLIVAPLVELYIIIQVAQVIGGWETIAFLIIESAIGAWLLKRQGLSTLNKVQQAVSEGRVPSRELVDGLLIIVAGSLMIAPGFVGDLLGYLLLIPVTRAPFRALVLKRFQDGKHGRFFAAAASGPGGSRFVGTFRAGSGSVFDTTGSAQPTDPPHGELEP